ncbi:LOW QUALITY PROTEIN: uncharacterized protein ms(3)76Cc [Drosophila tropicalis]|uniref:LOW QUALITY PROTEIN: uncharacterized protein ms(3)76Cc n=1 Tax=Drosophila tropicalis TaxID=46794 RepID=UPI0035ABC120
MAKSKGSSSIRLSGGRSGLCRPSSMPSCCRSKRSSQSDTSRSFCSYFSQPMCDQYYSVNPLDVACPPHLEPPNNCHRKLSIPNRSRVEADSVGKAVGLVCSNVKVRSSERELNEMKRDEADALNFATYLKAFALIYVLPEGDWTAEKIDMLLQEGADLFNQTSEAEDEEEAVDSNLLVRQPIIYTDAELRVKRTFTLEGHTFTLALEPRFWGDAKTPAELQPRHIMKNLRPILLSFFRTGSYCLLLTKVGHLLIWKRRRHVYFVLDVKGRRKDDLSSVNEQGVAMLVCLQSIDNVVHLASSLSGIQPQDEFTIRELVVMRLVTPDGRIFLRDAKQRPIEFRLIDKNYAYLKSNLHLSTNPNEPLKNRSALMVGVVAILASKIDHPATWNTNMLDQLICYGVELCRSLWAESWVKTHPIDLDAFPTQLRLGQFVVELKLIPNVRLSDWCCGIRIQGTNFEHHIRASLEEFSNCLFQINNQMYAIWLKDSFYYLLDPYRHHVMGTHVEEDKGSDAKWATVRMFRDLHTMLSVFQQVLKASNRQSQFYIHVVKIKNLAECPRGYALQPVPKGHEFEVQSLDERICFHQQEATNCAKSLMEISDYEADLLDKTLSQSVENLRLFDSSEDEYFGEGDNDNDNDDADAEDDDDHAYGEGPREKVNEGEEQKMRKSQAVSLALSNSQSKAADKPKTIKPLKFKSQNTILTPKIIKPMRTTTIIRKGLGGTFAMAKRFQDSPRKQNDNKKQKQVKPTNEEKKEQINSHGTTEQRTKVGNAVIISAEPTPPREALRGVYNPAAKPTIHYPSVVGKFKEESAKEGKEQRTEKDHRWCKGGQDKPLTINPTQQQAEVSQHCSAKQSSYPGFTRNPHVLAVVGSESGTVESLQRLLSSAFKVAGRVLTMTPWGNYVVFKHSPNKEIKSLAKYYVFDGCTCNIDRFRHLDLSCGQAGLVPFSSQSKVVCHMIDSRETKALRMLRSRLDESCRRFESFLECENQSN